MVLNGAVTFKSGIKHRGFKYTYSTTIRTWRLVCFKINSKYRISCSNVHFSSFFFLHYITRNLLPKKPLDTLIGCTTLFLKLFNTINRLHSVSMTTANPFAPSLLIFFPSFSPFLVPAHETKRYSSICFYTAAYVFLLPPYCTRSLDFKRFTLEQLYLGGTFPSG